MAWESPRERWNRVFELAIERFVNERLEPIGQPLQLLLAALPRLYLAVEGWLRFPLAPT
jgi:hypothetical protein